LTLKLTHVPVLILHTFWFNCVYGAPKSHGF